MGLDMYVHQRNKVTREMEEILYWRKANQIFNWFEKRLAPNGIENCKHYSVSIDDLECLYEDITTVLKDHSKASSVLPTTNGFFFGSTNYGEYYYSVLESTANNLHDLIANESITEDDELEFMAWW